MSYMSGLKKQMEQLLIQWAYVPVEEQMILC